MKEVGSFSLLVGLLTYNFLSSLIYGGNRWCFKKKCCAVSVGAVIILSLLQIKFLYFIFILYLVISFVIRFFKANNQALCMENVWKNNFVFL